MPYTPRETPPRCAVVDLGSNSVRLVVFEGLGRNPMSIFNEKAVLRLGRGLQASGRLNEDGVAQALTVMHRYHAVAKAMRSVPSLIKGPYFSRNRDRPMSSSASAYPTAARITSPFSTGSSGLKSRQRSP